MVVNLVQRPGGAISHYRSKLRAEQAAATRERIIEAAARLFETDGYARTSLARIAEAAHVSVETVQAQGPKRSLLGAAVRRLSFGREGDESFLGSPEARRLVAAATPAQFAKEAADLVSDLNSATHGLWRAFGCAAMDDPQVAPAWSEVSTLIRSNLSEVVLMLADRRWLRRDVDVEELTISLWLLIAAESFERVTTHGGWSIERYRRWLERSIDETLFPRSGDAAGRLPVCWDA